MAVIDLVRRCSASAWRHRWKAVALIWLVAVLGWTGVRMLPDRYVSTARIYADADAVLGMLLRGIAMDNSPAAQVEVLQRTLVSRPNLERLVDRTALSQRVAAGAHREMVDEGGIPDGSGAILAREEVARHDLHPRGLAVADGELLDGVQPLLPGPRGAGRPAHEGREEEVTVT